MEFVIAIAFIAVFIAGIVVGAIVWSDVPGRECQHTKLWDYKKLHIDGMDRKHLSITGECRSCEKVISLGRAHWFEWED